MTTLPLTEFPLEQNIQQVASQAASTEPEVTLLIPREKQHPGMPEEALTKVLEHINENTMNYILRAIPYCQQDGTYSLLLAGYGKRQRWIYSPQEWQEAYTLLCQTKRLKDIFAMSQTM